MHVSASQLKGSNRCFSRRERDFVLSENKPDYVKAAIIKKAAIKNYFISKLLEGKDDEVKRVYSAYIKTAKKEEDVEGKDKDTYYKLRSLLSSQRDLMSSYDEDEVLEIVEASKDFSYIKSWIEDMYYTLSYLSPAQADNQARTAVEQVLRYLRYETRTPELPRVKNLKIFGIDVDVKPDLLFHNIDGSIEAVKICCKKPDITKSGKKKDKSVNTSLELYALWCYARTLIPSPKDTKEVIASYYFLRRKDDTTGSMMPEFHDDKGAGNIVQMKELVTKTNVAKLDTLFKPQFTEYLAGEECTGEACEKCDFNKLCNFSKAPKVSEEEKPKKSVSDIELTKEQEEAVFYRKGICRINAGAGAGKTLVVALRTAYMLSEGIAPEDILLITFTESGASEMRERIEMYDEDLGTGTDMSRLRCLTFNAFGDLIVRDKYEELGFEEEPRVIDDIERKDIITGILNARNIPGLDYTNFDMAGNGYYGALPVAEEAFHIIKRDRLSKYDAALLEKAMNDGETKYSSSISDDRAYKALLEAYEEYNETLRDRNLIEFLDQEALIFDILASDPYYLDEFGFKHIVIDEFQDTSENQLKIIKKMIETKVFESLMVVGDDSQSIFSFRDAVPDNIIHFFEKIGKDGDDIYIMENHRSTPEILEFANSINDINIKKVAKALIPTREHGKKPEVKGFHSKEKEYEYIVNLAKEKIEEGNDPSDIAIIASTRKELIELAGALSENGVETSLACPEPMLDNSRVQGLVALCHFLKDSSSTEDIAVYENCLRDGKLLEEDDDEIKEILAKDIEMASKFRRLDFKEKLEKFSQMANEIADDDEIAVNLVKRLETFPTIADKYEYVDKFVKYGGERLKRDGKYSGVILTTAHSSKGREYKVVINTLTKYDTKKTLPHDKVEEKRRLLFVSATRAKDELYITGQYKVGGNMKDGYIYNRFVAESFNVLGEPYDPIDHEAEDKRRKAKEKAVTTVLKGQVTAF